MCERGPALVVAASDKQGKASLQFTVLKFCNYWDERGPMDQWTAEQRVVECIPCFLHCMRRTSCSVRGSDQQGEREATQAFAVALSMRGIGNLPTKKAERWQR